MSTIKELLIEIEKKAEIYNNKHMPTYLENTKHMNWIKGIDPNDGKCLIANEERTIMYVYDSIYVASHILDSQQFLWGYSASNLPQEMRNKSRPLIDFGEKNRLLEFMEAGLIVHPTSVETQKINRAIDNEAMCMRIGEDFCSKYHWHELIAIAAKVLRAESFLVLEFPDVNFNAIYFLYGEPEIIYS